MQSGSPWHNWPFSCPFHTAQVFCFLFFVFCLVTLASWWSLSVFAIAVPSTWPTFPQRRHSMLNSHHPRDSFFNYLKLQPHPHPAPPVSLPCIIFSTALTDFHFSVCVLLIFFHLNIILMRTGIFISFVHCCNLSGSNCAWNTVDTNKYMLAD